jgi:hypothetical protein
VIWHPLTWAFWAAVLTGTLLYAIAAVRAVNLVLGWAPEGADTDQLRRERHAETVSLLSRWALACLAVAAVIGLTGIALVWQRVVPGAMCGTGVLQAMGIHGSRAMIFWGIALTVMYAWLIMDRLNHYHPLGPLTQSAGRVLISVAPFLTVALLYSWQALMRVDTVSPVSCCAAIYDQVWVEPSDAMTSQHVVTLSVYSSLLSTAVLLGMAALRIRHPDRGPGTGLGAILLFWIPVTAIAVKQVWSAYYYQVLSHPCPWCLFQADYWCSGFAIFGLMTLVAWEGLALWLADRIRIRQPLLIQPAIERIRRSAWRMTVALIAFTLLTVIPALLWRLRTGTWLDGSA